MDRIVDRLYISLVKRILILPFCIGLNSCTKLNFDILNLNNNTITMLGHGGMGSVGTYPKNTFESIIRCFSLGMDGTELDVQLTKDSVLVAFHDEELLDNTNLKGKIIEHTWAEIKKGYYTKQTYLNYSIISLEQLFSTAKNIHNYTFSFDCKLYASDVNHNYCNVFITALITLIDKYGLEGSTYIESNNQMFLNLAKKRKPQYKLLLGTSSIDEGITIADSLQLFGLVLSTDFASKSEIDNVHRHGLIIVLWDVKTVNKHIAAICKNTDVIQSDNPKIIIRLLE